MAVPQILNMELPNDLAILSVVINPREMKTYVYKNLCTKATLFIIAIMWKLSKCPLTDEQINKMWCSHTMEYYSVITRNEVLIHAIT